MKAMISGFLFVFLIVSCTTTSNNKRDYTETISNYLQTDKKGNKHDLNFKVIEMNELKTISVSDSISFLTEEFKADQQVIINRIDLAKKMSEDLLEKEKNRKSPNSNQISKYENDILVMNQRIDSLNNLPADNLKGLDKRNPTDVLAIVVRCKYSINPPYASGGSTVEEVYDFVLSPDGKTCYTKTKVK